MTGFCERVVARVESHGLKVVNIVVHKPTNNRFGVNGGIGKSRSVRTLLDVARGDTVIGVLSFDTTETWYHITSTAVRNAYRGPRYTKGEGCFGYSTRELMAALGVKE